MNQEGDHKNCVSQLYPRLYTPGVQRTEAVEVKASRRRRRKSKKDGSVEGERKRKLSDEQVRFLELSFANEHKLESERKDKLALQLGLDPRQIAVWFQNKRARWKNQKLEQEYSKLKSAHEIVIIEKCRLETEVLKLKEQVSEAEKRMQKLSESFYGVSTSSSSSTSAETDEQQTFIDDFMVDEFNSLFYVPDYSYIYDLVSYGL